MRLLHLPGLDHQENPVGIAIGACSIATSYLSKFRIKDMFLVTFC